MSARQVRAAAASAAACEASVTVARSGRERIYLRGMCRYLLDLRDTPPPPGRIPAERRRALDEYAGVVLRQQQGGA